MAHKNTTDDFVSEQHLLDMLELADAFQFQESDVIAFDRILETLYGFFGYTSCSIHMIDPSGSFAYRAATRNMVDDIPDELVNAAQTESLFQDYMQPIMNKRPYIVTDYSQDSIVHFSDVVPDGFTSNLIIKIPLVAHDQVVGVLTIIKANESREWFNDNEEWLNVVGNQLGLLMQQMIASNNQVALALYRERERVSQELHDNLSQYVGTIKLYSEKLLNDWQAEARDDISDDISTINQLATDAYACIRDELVGLRFAKPKENIEKMIREYLVRFQEQWGILAVFSVIDPHGVLQLQPIDEMQLFRIVQEALTNVRRHASASNVSVSLETDDKSIRILIVDDGIGFIPANVPPDKMGLSIMRERAAEMGGVIKIVSAPNEGTILQIDVPIRLLGS